MKDLSFKKYWYFVTDSPFFSGKPSLVIRPRKIVSWGGEPETSRICVSPSIFHCLSAIAAIEESNSSTLYVYRTEQKVYAEKPDDVPDACVTKERWITNPTRFERVLTIPKDVIDFFISKQLFESNRGSGEYRHLRTQREERECFAYYLGKMHKTLSTVVGSQSDDIKETLSHLTKKTINDIFNIKRIKLKQQQRLELIS